MTTTRPPMSDQLVKRARNADVAGEVGRLLAEALHRMDLYAYRPAVR